MTWRTLGVERLRLWQSDVGDEITPIPEAEARRVPESLGMQRTIFRGGGVLWRNDSETGGHWPPVLLELFAWAPIIHISNIFHPLSLFSSSFLLPFLPPSLPPRLWFNWGNGRTNQELQYSARSAVLEISEHTGECRGETANPARVERTRRCS